MKKNIAIITMIALTLIGCSKRRSPVTPLFEVTQETMVATSTFTNTIHIQDSATQTSTSTVTSTSTPTDVIVIIDTNTPTNTNTFTNTFTSTFTSTASKTFTNTSTKTFTSTATITSTYTPVGTATPSNCIWCGPGGGYTLTNITNTIDPSTTCGTGKALRVDSTSTSTVVGKLILNTAVNVIDSVYISYKIYKPSNAGFSCLLNTTPTGPCTDFTVGGNTMVIPYSGALKEVDLYINGVNGYIIIDCIQYY